MNLKILYLIFLFPISLFSLSNDIMTYDPGIRGYEFGEKLSTIQQSEDQKKEFTLNASQSTPNKLSYSGIFLNRPVTLIYRFQQARLSSVNYVWDIPQSVIFYRMLQNMIQQKYQLIQEKEINTSTHIMEIKQYGLFLTNHDSTITNIDNQVIISQAIEVQLEQIQELSTKHTSYILEYRSPQTSSIIQQKIIKEDL